MMKWIGNVRFRETICLGLLSLLLCARGGIVYGQSIGVEETAIRRARQFEPIIVDAAERHGVNPHLLWVIAYLETRFDPRQKSPAGAQGLMQFMPATASSYGLTDPYNSIAAIDAAARYVRDLAARFSNRADLILAAYNSGEGTVEAYLSGRTINVGKRVINPKGVVTGGIPPYRETQRYVARGLKLLERLSAAPFFTAKDGKSAINEEWDAPRKIVHKSIRANNGQKQDLEKSERPISRRSIYFGPPRD
ncbi:MAG: lytic transglycosylase domain-containing protein [Blastocatellales bacterium]